MVFFDIDNKGFTPDLDEHIDHIEHDDEEYYDTISNPEEWVCKELSWDYSYIGVGFEGMQF